MGKLQGGEMVTIQDIMTKRVVTLHLDDSVATAIETLNAQHTGGLPVVDDEGAIVGMISELALIDVVFDSNMRYAPVSKFMTPNVQVVHPQELLSRAAQLFALYSFRRLPVVENGKLVGIVTRRDLMNHAMRTNETLAEPLVELIPSLAVMS
jgi:CBS domain-containing protein